MSASNQHRPKRAQSSAHCKGIAAAISCRIRICISPYTPGVKCSYTDHTQASGYQVELFKAIAANVTWLNANPWYFSCLKT
jgi:hypothetical protein